MMDLPKHKLDLITKFAAAVFNYLSDINAASCDIKVYFTSSNEVEFSIIDEATKAEVNYRFLWDEFEKVFDVPDFDTVMYSFMEHMLKHYEVSIDMARKRLVSAYTVQPSSN